MWCVSYRFTVDGLGFMGLTVDGLGFTVDGLGFTVDGLGFTVDGLGFTVDGLGFLVLVVCLWVRVYAKKVKDLEVKS